jgi:hypothetical protein
MQDTHTAATAWIGAINEVVVQRMAAGADLTTVMPSLRALLLRSVGARESDGTR